MAVDPIKEISRRNNYSEIAGFKAAIMQHVIRDRSLFTEGLVPKIIGLSKSNFLA